MKLKSEMLTHFMDGSQVMVSTDKDVFSGIVTSNKTAAFIVGCLKKETTPEAIKQAMFDKYDAPMEVISNDVDDVISKLRSIGVIEE
ncbi:PqqD family protein [Ruminococcus sp.]|uniref:PqqD family protein n=1 Tax=Ruminococcus sp. TaxID=41978 RepID=UPI002E787366|nr:PqqD family protein [Ruminococcus sp.]MEE1264570.1 PqqD family protein [Ruminococcus sp.]